MGKSTLEIIVTKCGLSYRDILHLNTIYQIGLGKFKDQEAFKSSKTTEKKAQPFFH